MFRDLAMAVADAPDSAIVALESGTHVGVGNRDVEWTGKELTLRSRTGDPADCFIDPIGTEADPHRVIYLHGVGAGCRIEGITFRGGHSTESWSSHGAGVMYFWDCEELTIANCVFTDNVADYGGALHGRGGHLRLVGCDFHHNTATGTWLAGAAICMFHTDVTLDCCDFWDNTSHGLGTLLIQFDNGGTPNQLIMDACHFTNNASHVSGGAVCTENTNVQATECVFVGNTSSTGSGGAMKLSESDHVELEECRFEDNQAAYRGGACYLSSVDLLTVRDTAFLDNIASSESGGAVFQIRGNTSMHWSSFVGNECRGSGGAFDHSQSIFSPDSYVHMDRCLLQANRSLEDHGAAIGCHQEGELVLSGCTFHDHDGETTLGAALLKVNGDTSINIQHCLITNNSCPDLIYNAHSSTSAPSFYCSNLYGNTWGDWVGDYADQLDDEGNMCAYPHYCGASSGDLSLRSNSPCLPDNNECSTQIGARGQGCEAPVGVEDDVPATALTCRNYPNPFNPQTTIAYALPVAGPVRLSVYDAAGRLVRVLESGAHHDAGRHTTVWDGRDQASRPLGSGVYLARVTAGGQSTVQRMLMLK